MPKINLGDGVTVHTYPAPPPSFDPAKADPRELKRLGLPSYPYEFPEIFKRWETLIRRRQCQFVDPILRPMESKRRQHLHPFNPKPGAPEVSTNWAGGIVSAPTGDQFKYITGTWKMPNVSLPVGGQAGTLYGTAFWIGIDGEHGSNDILQVGVEAELTPSGDVELVPFWEWWPGGPWVISGFSVSPGDDLQFSICADTPTSGQIWCINNTKGVTTHFSVTAPGAWIALKGNVAEWIVEDLVPPLKPAYYGSVAFTNCNAATRGGTVVKSGSGNTIAMVDASGDVPISVASLVGDTEVDVFDV